MCGIGGIVRLDGGKVDAWRLSAMSRRMRHRGPDGEGCWLNGPVGLVHVRLAIIDLDTGGQPMSNEDGSITTVFNGEIYNFLELRSALENHGHTFRTRSDTEVLVHAYEEWGHGMLSRLNGMFAFAIYDSRQAKLFLARDRLGVKPLYYYLNRNVFLFASEMGGILGSALVPQEIDRTGLDLYFHYQYIPAPFSIYRGVKKLSSAECAELTVPAGQFETTSYWDIDVNASPNASRCPLEWLEGLETLLNDAVRIRLISDVPFGAFLSGGTDSGLIVALMASNLTEPVRTFSIGLVGEDRDETPYARIVAQKYCTEHEEFCISPEGLALIPKISEHFGEPFADSSAVPTYCVSQLAGSRVKMVLTGDGGDEIFAGYGRYSTVDLTQSGPSRILRYLVKDWAKGIASLTPPLLKQGPWRRSLVRQALYHIGRTIAVTRRTFALARQMEREKKRPWYQNYDVLIRHFSLAERKVLLGNRSNGLSDADFFALRYPYPASDHIVATAQYCDLKTYLPDDILVKVDRMSMASSLEVRSPLLDYRIAEWAFSMPSSLKLPRHNPDGSTGKFILKELAARYLGREYVYRPKTGFCIPVSRWLREDARGYLKDSLFGASPIYDFLDRDFIHPMIHAHMSGLQDNSFKIWNLLMFDGWLRYVHRSSHGPQS